MKMAQRSDDWSIGDYLEHFEQEIKRASDPVFKEKFHLLAGELELMDSQFLKESKGCVKGLDPLLDQLHSISGRLGYCRNPSEFERDCQQIYKDMDEVIESVRDFRDRCTE